MSIFGVQNPGIGGLQELTDSEALFLQSLASSSFNEGDILTIVGSEPTWQPNTGSVNYAKTLIPKPVLPLSTTLTTIESVSLLDNYMEISQVIIDFPIIANKISFIAGVVSTSGKIKITMYDETGAQIFSEESPAIGVDTQNYLYEITLSSIVIQPGIYYIGVNRDSSFAGNIYFYSDSLDSVFDNVGTVSIVDGVIGKNILRGQVSMFPNSPPGSISPETDIVYSGNTTSCILFRLDN